MSFAIILSLIGIYLVWFVSYLFTVDLGRHYFRAINKVFLAIIYLCLTVIAFCISSIDKSLSIFILIALIFTCIGDIVLMFHFTIGAAFFTLGNVFLFIYEICILRYLNISFNKYWWFILIFILIFTIGAIYFKKSKSIELKGKYSQILGYLFFVTMHGALSFVITLIVKKPTILPLTLGSILFMSSDFILAKYEFSINKAMSVQRMNTVCYFMGILLISVSLLMYNT